MIVVKVVNQSEAIGFVNVLDAILAKKPEQLQSSNDSVTVSVDSLKDDMGLEGADSRKPLPLGLDGLLALFDRQ